jgi:hypothetical protein
MTERLYLDRTDVHLVVGWDVGQRAGQVRLVVCEHPSGVAYASLLAARFGVPLRRVALHAVPEPDEVLPHREHATAPAAGPRAGVGAT